jgi:hypothetical protein
MEIKGKIQTCNCRDNSQNKIRMTPRNRPKRLKNTVCIRTYRLEYQSFSFSFSLFLFLSLSLSLSRGEFLSLFGPTQILPQVSFLTESFASFFVPILAIIKLSRKAAANFPVFQKKQK